MKANELQNATEKVEQNLTDLEPVEQVTGGAGENTYTGVLTLGSSAHSGNFTLTFNGQTSAAAVKVSDAKTGQGS